MATDINEKMTKREDPKWRGCCGVRHVFDVFPVGSYGDRFTSYLVVEFAGWCTRVQKEATKGESPPTRRAKVWFEQE